MRKQLLLILFACMALCVPAANYGILVNGDTYYAAEHKEPNGDYDQYNAKVPLVAGDKFVLYNAEAHETWTVDLDSWSVKTISRNEQEGCYVVSEDGCYDCWIKLLYRQDQLYIGKTSGCGTGEPYIVTPSCPEAFGLLIDGVYHAGKRNLLQPEWKEYMLRDVELVKGQKIQLYDTCNHVSWIMKTFAPTSFEFPIEDDKYVVPSDGVYDFYLKFIYGADEVYIAKHGVYNSAVPGLCEDVMMQAFYNESYQPNNPKYGTDKYGDTKWVTLLPQADTIGKYFDLVWLPPSAYGDGMGYHPKKYDDQNSNWGTREELEALIEAFHHAGSKVIADIVINHCAGWTSWCDFPELDFGEYGVFHPDASYICKNDEVNAEWNKPTTGNPGSGACWGKATGNYDDGDNWDGARDWAHDNVYVQEMFKAYLKWMRNVMKYDGFRYDKGDGFNNWHHDNYNKAAGPYIAFMESFNGSDRIISEIEGANRNLMALDFDTRWALSGTIPAWKYNACQGSGLLGRGYAKYAVTFLDSHDWFLREDNENEFGGRGNSMKTELKDRLMQANAFLLGMPGLPCVFYPHWVKYQEDIKPMINARKLAGVHTESPVTDEQVEEKGYQCTVRGKFGWLILQLGNKTTHSNTGNYSWLSDYKLIAKGDGYAMWVNRTVPLPMDTEGMNRVPSEIRKEKFLRNGQLYIRIGEKTYDITGKLTN